MRAERHESASGDAPDEMATPSQQIERLVRGLQLGGATVVGVTAMNRRPVQLGIVLGDASSVEITTFCWNVGLGGRGRDSERRVQATGVPRPLYRPAEPPPLLLGYEDNLDVFVAWDATKHREIGAGRSNSLFVPYQTLVMAKARGIEEHEQSVGRTDHEVVMAFRPEMAENYLRILPALQVSSGQALRATTRALAGSPLPLSGISQARRRVLRTASTAFRDGRFRGEVMAAYQERCAFCGLGSGLAQAAHIQGVHNNGPDHVTNGLAACPTHHRAYDLGILLIGDDFVVTLNPAPKGAPLTDRDRRMLQSSVRTRLLLPAQRSAWPDRRFLAAHRRETR